MIEVIAITINLFFLFIVAVPVLIYGLIYLLPEYKERDTDEH